MSTITVDDTIAHGRAANRLSFLGNKIRIAADGWLIDRETVRNQKGANH
ncbi:MAG: hypothetical protein WBE74_01820 [Terracidiphilus sp.]